ncbi:MAG TPA: FAD-dependent oxidoreductase [Candidatus Cloacimonadota bacterium]|nr:FAD-dependent oxidoreductase [Candidatus Cloacimonadota bacterium]
MKNYDVIIIGAGSIGVPTAMYLAEKKMKVLVLDGEHGPGQQNNKKAIGGIRATHSDFGKISVCLRSIEILKNWQEERGDDIGWMSNGYSYPAYNKEDADTLKALMKIQLGFGLNIKWLSPEEYNEIVPGINMDGLLGSTYSEEDGSCSPLLTSLISNPSISRRDLYIPDKAESSSTNKIFFFISIILIYYYIPS